MAYFDNVIVESPTIGGLQVSLSWQSVSVQNNSTTIKWNLNAFNGSSSAILGATSAAYSVIIDGQSFSGRCNANLIRNESKTLVSGTVILQHELDGTKTFDYSFSQAFGTGLKDVVSGSGTATLEIIPKVATLLTAPNFTDEENPTITYDNPAGATLDELQACIANDKGNAIFVPYRNVNMTAGTYTFNLTIDERNALRAAATSSMLQLRFYIRSVYKGSTSWSFLDRTMTLEDIEPELYPTINEGDEDIYALTGGTGIILGFSDIDYNIGVSAPVGTSIITQSIKCGAQTSTTNVGTFKDVSTNVVEFSATDSRGNVASAKQELNVIPYKNITCNQLLKLNLDGTIDLTIKGNYFSDSFGAQNNTIKIESRSREVGGEWSAWGDISVLLADASNGEYLLTGTISGYDPSGTYEFQARASDKLTSAESSIDTITLKPIFDWSRTDFNFNVPLTIEGDTLNDYVIETGTEAMGTNGTWYWRKWKSGRAECYGYRNFGNMAVSTAWGNLYRSEIFTQSLPSGLFAQSPEMIDINYLAGSFGGWVVRHEQTPASKINTGSFILVRPASATVSQGHFCFNVIGRWK